VFTYPQLIALNFPGSGPLPAQYNKGRNGMFAVVGLTLDDIWSGALPQMRLAKALEARGKEGLARAPATQPIVIYTTDPNDTQGPIARTKYKDRGTFVTLLYFSDAAVEACHELHIPLRILEHVDEGGLPAKKVVAFQHPSTAPATK
jgi:hypothetical protein